MGGGKMFFKAPSLVFIRWRGGGGGKAVGRKGLGKDGSVQSR